MTAAEFLKELLREGIHLRLEGGRLVSEAPKGVLTQERVQDIRRRKQELVDFLSHASQSGRPSSGPIGKAEVEGPPPLSFAQQRLWFVERLDEGTNLFNLPFTLEIRGDLDKEVLRRSIQALVDRHEVLRTTFPEKDGVPYQAIAPESSEEAWAWTDVDLGDGTGMDSTQSLESLLRNHAGGPFDLAAGPLLRVGLFRRGIDDHVLQVVMHHTVSDGWSVGVFRRELGALYRAYKAGDPSPLPSLEIQYADYAAWQRGWLQGEVLENQLGYWRDQLEGLPPLELPADRPRPPTPSYGGGTLSFRLPPEVAEGLHELGREQGSTLFMTLMAAFHVLLHRYTDQTDIAVGTPIAGRNRKELEGQLGMFVNTLVIRSGISGDMSFLEFLEQIRHTSLEAQAHQDLPFEKLVEELQPQRDLSRNPLFQVMFALQNVPHADLELPGLEVRPLDMGGAPAEFDLALFLREFGEGTEESLEEVGAEIEGTWSYALDLFDEVTVERMGRHFQTLLRGIVAEPDSPVGDLPLLTAGERRVLLEDWSRGPELEVTGSGCAHLLFEAQVAKDPHRVAVVAEDGELTYGQLEGKANQLARHLAKLGVGPEVLVGVSLPRTTDMVVGVLGILKAGGAYLPLDPDLPSERLRYMLDDGGARVLVTTSHDLESFPNFGGDVVCLDTEARNLEAMPDTRLDVAVRPHHLAYVIYTSGSTGRPKGVEVEHGQVAGYFQSVSRWPGFSEDDVFLAVATLSFDVSVEEVLGSLCVGARLILVSSKDVRDGHGLRTRIEEAEPTILDCTPAIWRTLFDTGWPGSQTMRGWVGGEALSPDLARTMQSRLGEAWNTYGPTEATVGATAWRIPPHPEQIRLGTPLGNYQTYVLDGRMQPVPVGVPGELYIGGVGVARGYRERPELTAERFVPDPFQEHAPAGDDGEYDGDAGRRLYRTGDRVRFRNDGNLEFLGRLDGQVKVRGLRIELGEIESVLVEHDAVRQVAAKVDGQGVDARLVAYAVLEEGEALDLRGMRDFLGRFLPDYMVPSLLVKLDDLPLTPSGKVDREALPDPSEAGGAGSEDYVAPRTETEAVLAGIWREVLGRERIGIHDDFFGLGGHSLLATQVMSRVARSLGVELPLRALFESPTLEELAEKIGEVGPTPDQALPAIESLPRDGFLPLSFAQQRLWFLDRIEERSSLYNVPSVVELLGPLDREALMRAVEAIVQRHEVLRTTFKDEDGVPYQVIAPASSSGTWGWKDVDLSGREDLDGEGSLQQILKAEAGRPFDLERGPLLRVGLFRRGDEDHVLQVVMHHTVSDGWSLSVFQRELSTLYGAFAAGKPSPLSPPEIQYADYAAWQHEWFRGEVLENQVRYWRERLQGLEPLELPTDRPRPSYQSFRGGTQEFEISSDLTQRLNALGREEGATLFMTLMAAFHVLLHRYSDQADIAVGTPNAGRTRRELEALMGMFVNTLVIRSDCSDDLSFRALLRQIRDRSLEAQDHQDLPFEKLVEELQPQRDLSRNPLFQVMFALQNAPEEDPALPGLQARSLPSGGDQAEFDLGLFLREADGVEGRNGVRGAWSYALDLFDMTTIRRMARQFSTLLEGIVANPDSLVGDLPLLAERERRTLLEDWARGPTAEVRAGVFFQDLFEARVAENPDRVAVKAEDGILTYGELNTKANQLAQRLADLGVEPEMLVGLSLPRTTDMVVAFMGILKAGGAYLPLDPDLPAERLAYMLEDGDVSILVTTSQGLTSFPGFRGEVVLLDAEASDLGALPDARPAVAVQPDHLAYVIYTSGSTGRPKGVEVLHRNLVAYLRSWVARPGLSADETVLATSSLSFDASVDELFAPLIVGATTVLTSWDAIADREDLVDLLRESKANVLSTTPSPLRMLFDGDWTGDQGLRIWTGGEALPLDLARDLVRHCGEVWNTYGPTETTVTATAWKVPSDVKTVTIGTPLNNYEVYVLDRRLQPVPVGVPGELYIGGLGVTRGYRNLPDLTRRHFIPNHFNPGEGGRLFRTGDKVKVQADGALEFLGRFDDQVKIRGFRIELGEIETVLGDHEVVRDAAVLVHGEGIDARLVAYVVFYPGQGLTSTELRRYLRRSLPRYMVPSIMVEVDELPLTVSGKLDRKALPDPTLGAAEGGRDLSPPQTPEEILIGDVWRELLELDQVSRTDNFFEIGGHSLLSIRAVSMIEKRTGQKLDPRTMFFQTLEQLAQSLVGKSDPT